LFVGATYILVPSPTIAEMRVLQFELLLRELGAQPVRLTASEHDEVMAMISHLPQLLSTAMVATIAGHGSKHDLRQFAGNGFRDMSRLGLSSWSVWQDICTTNRDNIAVALDELSAILQQLREALAEEQYQRIGEFFAAAKQSLK
ncbi:MAG: prephenate dehydrogenase dimerization domain-containing protein, partial [Acidobacteriota bacterium]